MVKKITYEQAGLSGNPLLSAAYKSNGIVFTSGSIGQKDGVYPEDVSEQAELAIQNLFKVLKASGSSPDRVLKVLLFVSNGDDAAAVNKVYSKYFPSKPARSCIVVSFPNKSVKVEMECIAEAKSFWKL
ncbi:unnamed protein product [Kuraishia capsulata CBS 1993]|uniref:Uncharacterized protein n=1 Tax=Kuraishia capsulata CBS 1993 TaxID=1382522 RepID=W6MW05_9ASCO|nr:uncharacterized protein KUCA_T00002699001 [Kuraishia capsulata CBS 1993]CDK26725.1 unnamed protein product [Kuraishia capsulata CBS 1993]